MATALQMGANHGLVDPQERLSSIARDMHFALTARQGFHLQGGATVDSTYGAYHASVMEVKVGAVGPLSIVSPTAGATIFVGPLQIAFQLQGYASNSDAASNQGKSSRPVWR